jgi:hypothetical protein
MPQLVRNIIFGFCAMLIAQTLIAQMNIDVKIGPLLDENKGKDLQHIFGTDSAHFFTLRYTGRKKDGIAVEKIRTDSLMWERTLNVEFPLIEGKEPLLLYPVSMTGMNCLLTTTDENLGDRVYIHAWMLNQIPELNNEPVLLGTASKRVLNAGQEFLTFSNSERDMLAVIIPTEAEPIKNMKFELSLYDSSLKLLKKKNLEIPHSSGKFYFENVLIDDTTSVHMLISLPGQKISEKDQRQNATRNYALIKYSWLDEVLQEKSLSVGTKWLYEVGVLKNNESNIQVAGYYSNLIELTMAGTFSVELEPDSGKILNQGLVPFERSFKTQFKQEGLNPDKTDLGMYTIGYINPTAEGLTEMISEKQSTQTSTVFNPATGTYSVIKIYNFDHILINRIEPSGKISYSVKIPKLQSSARTEGEYTSYVSFRKKNKTYFIYNDHERNEGLQLADEKSYRSLNSYATCLPLIVEIGSDGLVKKQTIMRSTDSKAIINPRFSYLLPNGIVLVGFAGSRTQYIKVNLN